MSLGSAVSIVSSTGGSGITDWTAAVSYVAGVNYVSQSNIIYKCLVTHTAGVSFATDLAANKWVAQSNQGTGGGSGGGTATPKTSTAVAYTTGMTVNMDFASVTGNIDLGNVTGNLIVTGSNLSSNVEGIILIRKATASPITITFDSITLPAIVLKQCTTLASDQGSAPPSLILNGASGTVFRLYMFIDGATGALISNAIITNIAPDAAINVTANYNSIYTNHNTFNTPAADTLVEHIMHSFVIPANTFKSGSYLKGQIDFDCGFNANVGTIQVKVRIGPAGANDTTIANNTTYPRLDDYAMTRGGGNVERYFYMNVISATSQKVKAGYSGVNNQIPYGNMSVDLTTNLTVYLTYEKKSAAADSGTLTSLKFEGGNLS
jgi:hypothetical protein